MPAEPPGYYKGVGLARNQAPWGEETLAQIILMIPTKDSFFDRMVKTGAEQMLNATTIGKAASMAGIDLFPDDPPWIQGECTAKGYEGMILVKDVEYSTLIDDDEPLDGRRTLHLPKMEPVKISRTVDTSSSSLTKWSLVSRVSKYPWEMYFLRGVGKSGLLPQDIQRRKLSRERGQEHPDLLGTMQVCFMTIKFHQPLITGYEFSIGAEEAEETIEVSCTKVEWIYHQTDQDQRVLGKVTVTFDMQSGQVY